MAYRTASTLVAGDPELQSVRGIYAQLRGEIVTLQLAPGAKLSENELAARFGTSRAPVREALIRLAEEGLITVRPQRGSFVSRISLKAMERARFTREALEVAIVRRAAEIGITPAWLKQFEKALAGQREAEADPASFTDYDDQFHRTFAEAAGLEGVWSTIEREKAQFDRIRFLSLPRVTPVDVLIDQHRAILDAVVHKDPVAAEAMMRQHLSEVLTAADRIKAEHPDLVQP
ncbi:GntR family transcriptional regulator [Alsobacter soli]|uniref:GntR family transcriptional regulator n=1 Tax=Alsobacter soli TaxID=2109933 RepID=A0A2T1HRC0_9HYPH|nr:GntR family transcriptional regulator [Alsobacter soli]PSC04183.1 GntR family transcriptional regulator [Alsobacter soli]